nr:type I 3-dehydroquinate dehydratase [Chthoniobacterales bacterium]
PLIMTARHPQEGGKHNLSPTRRRELLQRFLPVAQLVDVELRSARQLAPLLRTTHERGVGLIISVHKLDRMPSQQWMKAQLKAALRLRPRIFKLAVRTDTPNDVLELLAFYTEASGRVPLAAMGVGKCGRSARVALLHHGSVHNYGYLVDPQLPGQISLAALRRIRQKRRTDRI